MSREALARAARGYFQDARRLEAMPGEFGGMTGEQWAIVYRAVSSELTKCAEAVDDAEQAAS